METKIVRIEEDNLDEKALQEAGEIIRNGGLVAFPTETVYGLGGDALNPLSSRNIYAAKGRPSDNPLIVHISSFFDLAKITARVTPEAEALAKAFWPGPLTMVLEKSDCVPYETTGGLDTVAVRMPDHVIAGKLIAYGGGYIAAPSANTSGKPSPTRAKYVIEDLSGKIDMIVDGGDTHIGLESTIVDMTVSPPQILRPGYITAKMLSEVVGDISYDPALFCVTQGQAPRAPGMKYRHYAPKGELTVVKGRQEDVVSYINTRIEEDQKNGETVGVIATAQTYDRYRAFSVKSVGSRYDEESIARHLYNILREFDDEQVTRIYSEGFGAEGFGQAIMNRLLKAAGHSVIEL